jgi:hypothetical protein
VTMPEAAVNENHCIPTRENHIGATRQSSPLQAKPQPGLVQMRANDSLGLRVPPLYAGHHAASTGRIIDISQESIARECHQRLFIRRKPSSASFTTYVRYQCLRDRLNDGHSDRIAELPICLRV